jgi:O-antigen/teichoic acid export membrane protein
VLSNWGTFAFSAAVNFVLSPIVVRSLGETQYGAWVLLASMVGYLGLLDLGVRAAVTRYIAQFHAAAEHSRASLLYASALRIFSLAGVTAILISAVLAILVGRVFSVPPELVEVARVVAVLSGVSVAISLISGVFGGVLIGLERFDYNNAIEIVVGALRAIGVLVVLKLGYGLIALALIQVVTSILRLLANIHFTRRLYPQLDLSSWTWDRDSARLVFKFGLSASLLHVTGSLMLYSDSLVIGAFLPVGMVTYFAIAGNLNDYARAVVSGISGTLSPRISALQAGGHRSSLQNAFLMSARLASLVVLPIVVTFLVRGASFIGLWMGPEYAVLSGQVLQVLALTLVPLAGYQVVTAALFGINKHGALIPVFLAEAAVNLVLSVLLVRRYGVVGTAIGTLVPRLIISTLIGPWLMRRHLGISLRAFWLAAFVQPILAMIPFAAASMTMERLYPAHSLAVYFGQVILLLPFVAISTWYICLSVEERARLRRALGRGAGDTLRA